MSRCRERRSPFFNVGGSFYAVDNISTHRGGPTRRKPRRWFLKLFLVLLALVGAAPYIIAYTPLKDAILRWAMKDQLNGSLTVGSLSLPVGRS